MCVCVLTYPYHKPWYHLTLRQAEAATALPSLVTLASSALAPAPAPAPALAPALRHGKPQLRLPVVDRSRPLHPTDSKPASCFPTSNLTTSGVTWKKSIKRAQSRYTLLVSPYYISMKSLLYKIGVVRGKAGEYSLSKKKYGTFSHNLPQFFHLTY